MYEERVTTLQGVEVACEPIVTPSESLESTRKLVLVGQGWAGGRRTGRHLHCTKPLRPLSRVRPYVLE